MTEGAASIVVFSAAHFGEVDLEILREEPVKQALRDHEGLVCSHQVVEERRLGTLWSVVGHPCERQLDIAAGSPCQAAYRTVSF